MTEPREIALDTAADDALLARLRHVVAQVDAPPPQVTELARAALSLRDLDAELAVLVLDSAEPGQELAGVRGADDDVRLLSFQAQEVGLELQVQAQGERRSLTGQVVGPTPELLVVQTSQGEQVVEADDHGVFVADGLPCGRVRVRVTLPRGLVVVSPWTRI